MARIRKESPKVAASVAGETAGAASGDLRADAPESTVKRRRGAPANNVNAATDPEFTMRMRKANAAKKKGLATRRRAHARQADATIESVGLGDTPLGVSLATDLAIVSREKEELVRIVDKVGRTNRVGQLTPPYEKLLSVVERSFVLHRELVGRLAEFAAANPPDRGNVVYRVTFGGHHIAPGGDPRISRPETTPCPTCGLYPADEAAEADEFGSDDELSPRSTGASHADRAVFDERNGPDTGPPHDPWQVGVPRRDAPAPNLDRPSVQPSREVANTATPPPPLPEGPVETPDPMSDPAYVRALAEAKTSHAIGCECSRCGRGGFLAGTRLKN